MKWPAFLILLLCAAPAYAQMTPTPDDRAKQWLTLVDDGNYAEAYSQAGTLLRARPVTVWIEKTSADRAPLGAMAARNLKEVRLAGARPGRRDGQTVIVRYDSSFAHRAAAVETVTLSSENGAWSVQSYSIQ